MCYKAIDLVYAIDISGSIGKTGGRTDPDNINYMIQFINSLVKGFTISSANAHIALLTFNDEVKIHTHLTDQKEIFDEQTNHVRDYCCSGRGATSLALEISNEIFKGNQRHNISAKALVLLTDGSCNSNNIRRCSEIRDVAQRLKNSGVNILTVGIRLRRTDEEQLITIASDPEKDYFPVQTFADLQDIEQRVVNQLYQGISYI